MVKLGIFGDSFGDDTSLWGNEWKDVGPSWIDYLRNTGKYEITNFSEAGTNTYFSKRLFDQHYHKFDKIVWMETFPYGRVDTRGLGNFKSTSISQFFNIHCIPKYEKEITKYNFLERRIIKAVKNYYMYVIDEEYDTDLHNLWLEDAQIKFPSIIIIPCFIKNKFNDVPLIEVVRKEARFWNLEVEMPADDDYYEARKCHMCEENNLILGKKMERFLEGDKVHFEIEDFVNPTKDFNHYFRKRK